MIKFWQKFNKFGQCGQTSVEYILLLAAMIVIITSILSGVRDRLISNQDACVATNTSIGCAITRGASTFGALPSDDPAAPTFRFFQVRR